MPLTLQQRLERAIDAIRTHAQAVKLFELERFVSIKEEILEVLG